MRRVGEYMAYAFIGVGAGVLTAVMAKAIQGDGVIIPLLAGIAWAAFFVGAALYTTKPPSPAKEPEQPGPLAGWVKKPVEEQKNKGGADDKTRP